MSRLTDQQKRAVDSIHASVLVSAGAGSGKTHVLVERYVQTLRSLPHLSVHNIVAVTYTKKAAQEMRTRLKGRMDELLESACSDEERERWWQCRAEIDGARIGTIHSLCDSILRSFPAEAGIDPQFQVLDDLSQSELLAESIERALVQAVSEGSEESELLAQFPVEWVSEWIAALARSSLRFREALEPFGSLRQADISAHFQRLLARMQMQAVKAVLASPAWGADLAVARDTVLDSASRLEAVRKEAVSLAETLQSRFGAATELTVEQGRDAMALLQALDGVINLKLGGRDEESRSVRDALKSLRQVVREWRKQVPSAWEDHDEVCVRFIRMLALAADRCLGIYDRAKKNSQRLDFDDLIRGTYELLARPGSAARKFYSSTVGAILVDEFQDTNDLQARLISLLAGPETRLFLIGDDKQSIYKFQGADVATFNVWRDLFSGSGGGNGIAIAGERKVETLSMSFRSHPDLVDFVNVVGGKLLGDCPAGGQESFMARFEPLHPSRDDESDPSRVEVMLLHYDFGEDRPDSVVLKEFEADAVASWIERKVRARHVVREKDGAVRPLEYGDFAVLVQRNSDIAAIEAALSRADIPSVALGGSSFLQRQEVYDMENMLRFLSSPLDSQSLLGVLRSPMFGIADDVIHEIQAGRRRALWESVQAAAAASGDGGPLARASRVLRRLAEDSGVLALVDLVNKIIECTAYDVVLLGYPDGRQRSRNLWKVAALAAEHSHLSPGDFARCLEAMRNLNVKQNAAPLDSGNSVKLMTIHSSKGLEFPAVALPVLGAEAARLSGKLHFDRQYGMALDIVRNGDDAKPAPVQLARLIERRMAEAERKRLLYVAMTRARDHLGIFLQRQGRSTASFRTWLSSALDLSLQDHGDDGVHRFSSVHGSASCLVKCVNGPSAAGGEGPDSGCGGASVPGGSERCPAATGSGDSSEQEPDAAIVAAMVAPLPSVEPAAGPDWHSLLRVTPAEGVASESQLKQVVIGNFFHAAMEHLPRDGRMPSEAILEDIAAAPGIAVVHPELRRVLIESGRELISRFLGSELCKLMLSARTCLHEAPYLVARDEGKEKRRPDLLLEDEKGRWHVIDFKTDRFELSHLEAQAGEHARQLSRYAEDVERLTGARPRRAVYFAQHGILLGLDD